MKFGVKSVRERVGGAHLLQLSCIVQRINHAYLDELRSRHDDRAALVFMEPEELISVVLEVI